MSSSAPFAHTCPYTRGEERRPGQVRRRRPRILGTRERQMSSRAANFLSLARGPSLSAIIGENRRALRIMPRSYRTRPSLSRSISLYITLSLAICVARRTKSRFIDAPAVHKERERSQKRSTSFRKKCERMCTHKLSRPTYFARRCTTEGRGRVCREREGEPQALKPCVSTGLFLLPLCFFFVLLASLSLSLAKFIGFLAAASLFATRVDACTRCVMLVHKEKRAMQPRGARSSV